MTSHKISRKTLFWVCVAHVLVLLLAVFFAHLLAPTPPPKMLEVVGLKENLNPAEGTPSAQSRGPANPNPTPQSAAPAPAPSQPSPPTPQPTPPAPQPTPPQPVPPQPHVTQPTPTPPTPVVKNDFPTEPPPKPVKPKVKVNLTETTRNSSTNNTSTVKPSLTSTQRSTSTGGGVSANSVEQSLNRAMGGDPNAGVSGGSRNGTDGSSGSPTGNKNGDWYRTLIKNTLERHWMKPQSDNPNLTTTVRIRVLADGTIEYLSMTSGSGDAAMDNSVVSAVRASGKVSIPPPEGFPKPYEDTVIFRLKGD